MKSLVAVVLLISVSFGAWAELKVPALTEPVIDQIGLMRSGDRHRLNQILLEMNKSGKAQVQVLVVQSLGGEAIESAAIRIFDTWKLGQEKSDNGVLFLVSRDDKKMRIEVGRGLEGAIPDITAKRILSDQVAPYFRAGDFSEGIMVGVQEILIRADKEFADAKPLETSSKAGRDFFIFFVLILIFIVMNLLRSGGGPGLRRGSYHGGWGGGSPWGGGGGWGSGGGGGWSGGGGSSAGGGASSGW